MTFLNDQRNNPALAKVIAARKFPVNTCPASRHASDIGEAFINGDINGDDEVLVLIDDYQHAGESVLLTVAALWETRTALDAARRLLDGLHDDDLSGLTGYGRERCAELLKAARGQK